MKISTKGRYSLRMMLDLAEHKETGFVALKDVAHRQGISKKYLEQLVPLLNSAGFIRANRGNQGGYMLTRSPDEYTVGQILRITEGSLCPVACLEDDPNRCTRADICKTLTTWQGLKNVVNEYLDSITLQMIIDENKTAHNGEYCI